MNYILKKYPKPLNYTIYSWINYYMQRYNDMLYKIVALYTIRNTICSKLNFSYMDRIAHQSSTNYFKILYNKL